MLINDKEKFMVLIRMDGVFSFLCGYVWGSSWLMGRIKYYRGRFGLIEFCLVNCNGEDSLGMFGGFS